MRADRMLVLLCLLAGCARRDVPARAPARSLAMLPVSVIEPPTLTLPAAPPPGDSARSAIDSDRVRLVLVEIAPSRETLAIPDAEPALPPATEPVTEPVAADDDLKPPIARTPARFVRPAPSPGGPRHVDLDVRIDETGAVSDALWAGGSADSAFVAAAIDAALGMRFFPALMRGRAVAVWSRQRLDVDR